MNIINNLSGLVLLSCLYSTTVLAVLLGYPGSVSVEVKPFSVKVTIKSHPSRYIIDPKLSKARLGSSPKEG
ncbi:MAG: hypothetical protein AAF915_11205 [Cyanobacteria bacterium P01_D01_bin.50]